MLKSCLLDKKLFENTQENIDYEVSLVSKNKVKIGVLHTQQLELMLLQLLVGMQTDPIEVTQTVPDHKVPSFHSLPSST